MKMFSNSAFFYALLLFNLSFSFFPRSDTVHDSLYVFELPNGENQRVKGIRLALTSLQGLVNRNQPKLFLDFTLDEVRALDWMLPVYEDKGYYAHKKEYQDAYDVVRDFKSVANGLVVIDPDKDYTVNVATNVAGVDDLIMVYPEQIPWIDLDVKLDLREQNFQSAYQAYKWWYDNYFDKQPHDVLANSGYSIQWDFNRDYLIAMKIPVFRYPDPSHTDYSDSLTILLDKILKETPENIPVMGFWPGVTEYGGVQHAGKFGKFTVVTDWVGNYSYHSGIPANPLNYRQKLQREKEFTEYDSTAKYVAITMIESGDSPGYMQYGMNFFQWQDSMRGEVAYNFSINPSMQYLLPGILEYFYETATPNDFFFSSISGMGYMYPYEQYGDSLDKSEVLKDYFSKTSEELKRMDIDMLGLYTHPPTLWTNQDDSITVNNIIPNIEGITSLIVDMGRLEGSTPSNANTMYGGNVSMHHCLTFWSSENFYPPYDVNNDQNAVNWLVSEIRNNSNGGQFLHMMAYSWHYGPRRMKMVEGILKQEGFKFVTLNEFEHHYRTVNEYELPSRDPHNLYTESSSSALSSSSESLNSSAALSSSSEEIVTLRLEELNVKQLNHVYDVLGRKVPLDEFLMPGIYWLRGDGLKRVRVP